MRKGINRGVKVMSSFINQNITLFQNDKFDLGRSRKSQRDRFIVHVGKGNSEHFRVISAFSDSTKSRKCNMYHLTHT